MLFELLVHVERAEVPVNGDELGATLMVQWNAPRRIDVALGRPVALCRGRARFQLRAWHAHGRGMDGTWRGQDGTRVEH